MKLTVLKKRGEYCPSDPEDAAEQLYLKQLDAASALAFRWHLQECRSCSRAYDRTVVFIESVRQAWAELAVSGGGAASA